MTTLQAIVEAARTAVAAISSEDGQGLFREHKTNEPFDAAPIGGNNGFEVVVRNEKLTGGFGQYLQREYQFDMVVRLGLLPGGTEPTRETNRTEDLEVVVDKLEWTAWPVGTHLVILEKVETDKTNPNWWIAELTFKVVCVGLNRVPAP